MPRLFLEGGVCAIYFPDCTYYARSILVIIYVVVAGMMQMQKYADLIIMYV